MFWIVADVLRGKESISMKNCVGCLTDGTSNREGQFNGFASRFRKKNNKRMAQPVSVDSILQTLRIRPQERPHGLLNLQIAPYTLTISFTRLPVD